MYTNNDYSTGRRAAIMLSVAIATILVSLILEGGIAHAESM